MTTILHLDASIRGADSVSRGLSAKLVAQLSGTDTRVIRRDLDADPLPHIDYARFGAHLTPDDERSDGQRELAALGDALIAELQAADVIVIGTAMYNWTTPSTLKAWADFVARAGTTFRYTENGPEGLLRGKTAYLAIATGGTPLRSKADFLTPWLEFHLGFLGIAEVHVVAADGVMGQDGTEKIAAAHEAITKLAA